MSMNKLSINNNTISFLGFDLLKKHVTFCFYPNGIAILPGWQPSSRPYYYKNKLNNKGELEDAVLVDILKDRGITNEVVFIQSGNHYIELTPHKPLGN